MRKNLQLAAFAAAGALLLVVVPGCGGGGGAGAPPPPPPPPPPAAGRNDSIATATPLGNGTSAASISPSGHTNSILAPDEDYYRIATTAAAIVTVDINAQANGSPLDSVIEIVAANGVRLNTCVAPTYFEACVHDDEDLSVMLDSFLQVQLGGPATIYVHVVDFRGDARPDMRYDIVISGVN